MSHVRFNVLVFILLSLSIISSAQTNAGNLQPVSLRLDTLLFNPEYSEQIFNPVMDFSAESSSGSTPMLTAEAISLISPVRQPAKKEQERFFDRRNGLLIASSAAVIALDGLSTQRFLSNPASYEVNPIARPFVTSRAGSAAYFGLSFVAEIGLMHFAHTHNHHRLEWLLPVLVLGSESLMVRNNYGLPTR